MKDHERLTAADVRGAFARLNVTQREVAQELARREGEARGVEPAVWPWDVILGRVQSGALELSQDEYSRLIAAAEAVARTRGQVA